MPEEFKKFQPEENHKEKNLPSEYVRLEADLLSNATKIEEKTPKNTILIYSQSHALLEDISNSLISATGPEVEVFSTFDKKVAIRFLENGE